ncbi:glycosyltransferase family 2 protein [Candidatus Woesearchaeota archaeon]|nr:glycosyltransferase family 2 protein [Candidatus Woesearchaeota archaeon]
MEKNKYPKILVGGPVSDHHDYCYLQFLETVKRLSYPNFDVFFVDNSKDEKFYNKIKKDFPNTERIQYNENVKIRLAESRNLARKKVLDEGYDYLFCIDQDVIAPPDIIQRLLAHGKEIVTGIYYNNFTKFNSLTNEYEQRKLPVVWVKSLKDENRLVSIRKEVIESGELIRIDSCGTGCILIHRSVLEKIKFRWEDDKPGVDDVFFCIDALKSGYEIYADTSIICEHLVDGRPIAWGKGDMKT